MVWVRVAGRALDVDATAATAVPPEEARDAAADILKGDKFHPAEVPKPLEGVLKTLGRWLEPVFDPIERFIAAVTRNRLAATTFVAVILVLAFMGIVQLVRRRGRAVLAERERSRGRQQRLDADALDHQAVEAEAAGDFERAVRLRFVAGLVRLDRAGVLRYQPALTSGQLTQVLESSTFDELATSFDEIVYGGRPATVDDVASARAGWPRVMAGVGKR